ncbi:MAG: hypothetical protein JKX97_09215 [Candidatus Lindowbacteria bacterium]|nr:hypothetical protein [Candidatus Lindowbacteria bacterium]
MELKIRNRHGESGVAATEYGIIITLLTATAFAVFPAIDIYGWGFDYKHSGEGKAQLAQLQTDGTSVQDLFDQSSTPNADPAANADPDPVPTVITPTVGNTTTINSNGSLTLTNGASPTFTILGSSITYGATGPQVPVSLSLNVNGQAQQLFKGTGSTVGNADPSVLSNLPAGSQLDFSGSSYYPWDDTNDIYTMNTQNNTPMIIALTNGMSIPDNTPFAQQPDIESFLGGIVDANGNVTIADNQILYLMELGTTNESSPAADFQDLVFMVEF